jgi:hypothetical protein
MGKRTEQSFFRGRSSKVIKKSEILLFAGECMELENIILSEVSQVQKVKSCMFSLICEIQI